ncbi:GNAT family N-acetyltransferase [Pontivivens insulae]|uniref:N-acetyltransferase domain-containing protein n=1 Tax=Pontivivens insulae TaxID=1639689 RepID=A0A2R8A7C9_9RHOB|nr:GNAT family N-acetyltransferase [Pontivivens insulae]RED18204.1 hypothetical protein DFR53_0399 [Pontivivens insulae]SPF28102.1 hypothetical protein POI8812_00400 [Pontivivens insulae]
MQKIQAHDIKREELDGRGKYTWALDGLEAELQYTVTSKDVRTADHAVVPPALQGSGVGHALVERMVNDARNSGWRIKPVCGFVASAKEKHPDWHDAFVN